MTRAQGDERIYSLHMRPCHQVEINTPQGIRLNGIWYGSNIPKRVIIMVHGLSGSVFSKGALVEQLAQQGTGVLVFNNRGHDRVASIATKTGKEKLAGAAHEVFEECVDDIDGAIAFAKQFHVPIYLVGSSTGCQKIVYWSKVRKARGVEGAILLAPISDYTSARTIAGDRAYEKNIKLAKSLIKKGRPHELITTDTSNWEMIVDAQRFVSLYSGEGNEEIFPYWDPQRVPKTVRAVKIPLFVLLAEKDEYADRSAERIAEWFEKNLYTGEVAIVPNVTHNFKGAEKNVSSLIRRFMKESAL